MSDDRFHDPEPRPPRPGTPEWFEAQLRKLWPDKYDAAGNELSERKEQDHAD